MEKVWVGLPSVIFQTDCFWVEKVTNGFGVFAYDIHNPESRYVILRRSTEEQAEHTLGAIWAAISRGEHMLDFRARIG